MNVMLYLQDKCQRYAALRKLLLQHIASVSVTSFIYLSGILLLCYRSTSESQILQRSQYFLVHLIIK